MSNQPSRVWLLIGGVVVGIAAAALLKGRFSMSSNSSAQTPYSEPASADQLAQPKGSLATFGNGCFWCTEAVFQQLKGVQSVTSGYSGGPMPNPTYDDVSTGESGHAEVIQIEYDPTVITFDELLEVFWQTHDPTTLNRQGNDVGSQYRSVVFYHDDAQRESAEHFKRKLDETNVFDAPIVTEISPFTAFFKAEKYHQNFYKNNPNQPYCAAVVRPKVEKFKKVFKDKLR